MEDQVSVKAIEDLKGMAIVYMERGNLDKAAEVMHLAEQIERRLYGVNNHVINMAQWQVEHHEKSKQSDHA